MFAARYQAKYESKYPGRRHPGPRRWLAILLLSTLLLFSTLDPATTFSRYMVNLTEMFNLTTSDFYLSPSLRDLEGNPITAALSYDWEAGFTEEPVILTVANYSGSQATSADLSYAITLNEAGSNPLFDLYMDSTEGKVLCQGSDTLPGGSATSKSYNLYFKLKDPANPPADGSYSLNLILASSEPYVRSFTFKVSIGFEEQDMVEIPGTEIERPNVEIPEGQIMVFKEEKYEYLTIDDLLVEQLIVDQVVQENDWDKDLIGGSLYVPASTGDLLLNQSDHINWDVYGHIVLEPDILVNSYKPVSMVSHAGDVILNSTIIAGNNKPYQVNITAENGSIEAKGATMVSTSSGSGIISLEAKLNIDVGAAAISSAGDGGINIQSQTGSIDAGNAEIISSGGAATADVLIQAPGYINLDGATVESKGSTLPPNAALLIESSGDSITAKSAILRSTGDGKILKIAAQGLIELDHTTVSSKGPLNITGAGGINAPGAALTAASYGGLLALSAQGDMILDQTSVSANGNIDIQTPGDITAQSAQISNTGYGHGIQLKSSNGAIELSAVEAVGIPQTTVSSPGNIKIHAQGDIRAVSAKISGTNSGFTVEIISASGEIDVSSSQASGAAISNISSADNILIKAGQDIRCLSARIAASTGGGRELRFQSTGTNRKLWVSNATLIGNSILAVSLQVQGTPANSANIRPQ